MTINEARLIREIKKGCTYRRLAEIYYTQDDPAYGNQGYGEDLCKEALSILYPDKSGLFSVGVNEKEDAKFGIENKSRVGDFFWWE